MFITSNYVQISKNLFKTNHLNNNKNKDNPIIKKLFLFIAK